MANYCVIKQQKIKTMSQLKNLWAHNARLYTPKNCNPEEHYMNEYMISTEDYMSSFKRLVEDRKIRRRQSATGQDNNSVLALEYYTAFTPGTRLSIEEWKEQNRKFFEDTFGKENVVSMIVHYDEHSPHIHTLVLPIVERQRTLKDGTTKEYLSLSAKEFTGSTKNALSKLQETYATYMKPFGLRKGKTVRNGKASHSDVEEFYKQIDEAANFQLPLPFPEEDLKEYIKRATPEIQEAAMNYQRMAYKWKRDLHEAEMQLEEQAPLIQWASSINNKELLTRLEKLTEHELEELLPENPQTHYMS